MAFKFNLSAFLILFLASFVEFVESFFFLFYSGFERRRMEELLDYNRLIYSIIEKYPGFDKEDLYQVSMIGLMEAEKHFDKSYQTKFSSFAYYYIIGEIHQYIRDTNKIKVSRKFIDLKKRVLQVKEEMTQRLGRVPTTLEISLMLDEDEKTIEEALLATDKVDSIDASSDSFPSYDFDMREDILDLREELKKLSLEEQKIIQARYYYDLTQQETSQLLGKSQVQISRYEGKILQKLKTRL